MPLGVRWNWSGLSLTVERHPVSDNANAAERLKVAGRVDRPPEEGAVGQHDYACVRAVVVDPAVY